MTQPVIYFISDTHLGDGSSADRFRYPDQLMDLLARIAVEPTAELVLLGDFMELWSASMEGVLIRHHAVMKAIGKIATTHPVTYVVGNHDCLPWYYYLESHLQNIRITERYTAESGALLALHGHQFDPFNQVKQSESGEVQEPWVHKVVWARGMIERFGGEVAKRAIEQILERESPGQRDYPLTESWYDQAAANLLRAGNRYVLMGHTHHPKRQTYGQRVYLNTGSWVWERYPPTYGRFAGGTLELLEANTHTPYAPPNL